MQAAIKIPTEELTHRLVDRLEPKVVNALTIIGFTIPAAVYFYALSQYSLNIIVGDQWNDVVVIGGWFYAPLRLELPLGSAQ